MNIKSNRKKMVSMHMNAIREFEVFKVKNYFGDSGCKILEIGGGNGYQASLLEKSGYKVVSVDVESRENKAKYFDVQVFNGKDLEFEDDYFDYIFSSNVLEHVENIDCLLSEIKRVVKKNGLIISIMPTPSWRIWSFFAYFIYFFGVLFIGNRKVLTLMPPPHGVFHNSLVEIYYYTSFNWTKVFERNQLKVIDKSKTNYFCTLYVLLPQLSLRLRKYISFFLGNSSNIYICKK